MTITCFVRIWPVLLSKRRPARIAVAAGDDGHLITPPSLPTHGVGPAPRHGAGGGCTCARRPTVTNRTTRSRATIFMARSLSSRCAKVKTLRTDEGRRKGALRLYVVS